MTETITRLTLDARCENLNRRLRPTGRHVELQNRNGYVAIDEYRGAGFCVRTITAGTKREIANFLHAMMVGMDMLTDYGRNQ